MTRKDFQVIAEAIKDINARKAHGDRIAELMAEALKKTNPRFDKKRFLTACGVEKVC